MKQGNTSDASARTIRATAAVLCLLGQFATPERPREVNERTTDVQVVNVRVLEDAVCLLLAQQSLSTSMSGLPSSGFP